MDDRLHATLPLDPASATGSRDLTVIRRHRAHPSQERRPVTAPSETMQSECIRLDDMLDLLRCPETGGPLTLREGRLVAPSGHHSYGRSTGGIPLFAEANCSAAARIQQAHYDAVAKAYVENLAYPHTQEYSASLDRALLDALRSERLGTVAEICCGRAEAFHLLHRRIERGVGADISVSMLEAALRDKPAAQFFFVQGDATRLPLASDAYDTVFMLGGIHHVPDRAALFAEVARILKPGGWFYFREPVSDFALWRWLRAVVYRLSPMLDHQNERPLLYRETAPPLAAAGLSLEHWTTHGFLGFCLFMNSDVLVVNRLLRFIPGIRGMARLATRVDAAFLALPFLRHAGLQVVGAARKDAGGSTRPTPAG
jgi:ubiquinone/menaquinone biosynthesis C-methylase UbiE